MSTPSQRLRLFRMVLFLSLLAVTLLGWWLAQASFTVAPTTYVPLAVKNLSPKRGSAGTTYVSDYDYLGVTWFYNWGPDWPWLFNWDPPSNSYGANPHNAYQFVPMLWCWWQLPTQVPPGTPVVTPIPTVYRDGAVLLWNEPGNPSTQCGQHYYGGPERWEGSLWPTPGPGTPTPTPNPTVPSIYFYGHVGQYDHCHITLPPGDPRLRPGENVNWTIQFPQVGTQYIVTANTDSTIDFAPTAGQPCPESVGSTWKLYS